MIRKYLIYLLLLFTIPVCAANVNDSLLIHNKWIAYVNIDCIYVMIFFPNNTFIDYDCEQQDYYSGLYTLINDTLIMETLSSREYEMSNTTEFFYRNKITYKVTDNCLLPIKIEDYDWVREVYEPKNNFVFDKDFFFVKYPICNK